MKRLALLALALYLLLCYRASLGSLGRASLLPQPLQRLAWLGHWRMFTELRPNHFDLQAAGRQADGWLEIDLSSRYPRTGEDGPGYLRDDLLDDPRRRGLLIADLCTIPGTSAIRLTLRRWPKVLGQADQPFADGSEQLLTEQECP